MGERKTYYVKVRPTNGGMHNKNQTYPFWTTVFDETTGNSYLSIQDCRVAQKSPTRHTGHCTAGMMPDMSIY